MTNHNVPVATLPNEDDPERPDKWLFSLKRGVSVG